MGSKLPYPGAFRTTAKRRTRPSEISSTIPRLPLFYVNESNLSGLGFSLKPPRWVRKLTIKKVIKPLAITAAIVGAAFIPGALPLVGKAAGLLAKGAVGAGRLALRGGKAAASGFKSTFFKRGAVTPQTTIPTTTSQPAPRASSSTSPPPGEPVPYSQPSYSPSELAPSGGGGYSEPATTAIETPAQAGMNASALLPIGVGLVALIAVSGALKRGRR